MSGETELWGGTVERSADGVSWTPVAKVIGVGLPKLTKNMRQVTNLDTPSRVHEYREGFADTGDLTIRAFYTEAGYVAAKTDEAAAAGTHYRVTPANGESFTFLCFPTVQITDTDAVDTEWKIEITGKTTGEEEFTAST